MVAMKKLFKGIIFIVFLGSMFLIGSCSKVPKVSMKKLDNDTNTNYNNYLYEQKLDVSNQNLFLIDDNNLIKLSDASEESIKNFDSKFQIVNGKIYYLDRGQLIESDVEGNEKKIIVESVSKFLVLQDGILYTKSSGQYEETLVFKSTNGDEQEIYRGIDWFCAYEDDVLVLKENNLNDEKFDVLTISKRGEIIKKITSLMCEDVLDRVYLAKNNLVFYDANVIKKLDLKTTKQQIIYNPPDGFFDLNMICDNNNLYVSVQEYGMDGSTTFDKENDKNGLYKISIHDGEIIKIRNETFDNLYLFNGYIFGYKDSFFKSNLFQVSESGDICIEIF